MQWGQTIYINNVWVCLLLQKNHEQRFSLELTAKVERCLAHFIAAINILTHQDASLELVNIVGSDGLHQIVLCKYLPVVDVASVSLTLLV